MICKIKRGYEENQAGEQNEKTDGGLRFTILSIWEKPANLRSYNNPPRYFVQNTGIHRL